MKKVGRHTGEDLEEALVPSECQLTPELCLFLVLIICAQNMGRKLHWGERHVLHNMSRLEELSLCINKILKQVYPAGATSFSHNKGQFHFHAL